ncbi:branched-chain amino acid ABC transporter permease [Halobacterium sp. KA-4]|uniref:branched-chain amino acid ABC transporter permease n=1 Tax=Halobacterium sp. KA-4 TaxID=2896367 RepID=UPI001E5A76ED|nr:branched-chain amino acid ABC transporter permease [Halobacterium sp. KA-4]MCD2201693.1 branched-chain amino acid ABC transporter permease [Halobacterium sp. KA-4]
MAQILAASTLEILVDGLARGVLFALLGLGITLVFGLGGVLNLAIGVFAVMAVLATVTLLGIVNSIVAAIIGGLLVILLIALVVDRTLFSLVYQSEGSERELLGIFVTLGLATFLDGLLYMHFPSGYSIPWRVGAINVGGLVFQSSSLLIIGVGIVLFIAFYAFLERTYLGSATRTVMQDETGALLCGINPRRIRTLVFLLSVLIAGIAGMLYSIAYTINVSAEFTLGIYAVLVSVVGGVTNVTGTIAAGLFLGVLFTFSNAWIGSFVANIIVFLVTVAVLITKAEVVSA